MFFTLPIYCCTPMCVSLALGNPNDRDLSFPDQPALLDQHRPHRVGQVPGAVGPEQPHRRGAHQEGFEGNHHSLSTSG